MSPTAFSEVVEELGIPIVELRFEHPKPVEEHISLKWRRFKFVIRAALPENEKEPSAENITRSVPEG